MDKEAGVLLLPWRKLQSKHQYTHELYTLRQTGSISSPQTSMELKVSMNKRKKGEEFSSKLKGAPSQEPCTALVVQNPRSEILVGSSLFGLQWLQVKSCRTQMYC